MNHKANSNQSISNHIVIQATPAEKKDSESTSTPASVASTSTPVTEIPASALPPAEDSIYPSPSVSEHSHVFGSGAIC